MSDSRRETARRAARPYLTTAASMLVVFGVGMIVLPLLPANSPAQRGENLWVWIPLGLVFVLVGSVWTVRRVRRYGWRHVGHPPIGPGT